ncbi:hypothetical protein FHX80_12650 [Streptomyces brevispora]|uniref:Peptidase M41 domain-containing protein n=1 Tax=Streptomyces brevispora TaxID=887462 RepID=A0A561TYZ5_9ACTN|nr:hypothetical protein FHX80_12650 [Streptomyces brevispora]
MHAGYLADAPDGSPVHSFHPAPSVWCCANHVLGLPLETDRQGVAVHEAGHLVAALVGGTHVIDVGLTSEEALFPCGPVHGVSGVTHTGPMAVHPESYLTMLAAGELAHQRWLRNSGLFTPARAWAVERGAVDDTGKAIGVLRQHSPGIPDDGYRQWFWQYRPAAEALLVAHWECVLNVAGPLGSRGHLNGDEAATLAGLPNPPELPSEL